MSDWPVIRRVGLSGLLVTFAARMSEPANRAALALRAAIDAEGWEGVTETSTSLVSTFIAVDLAAKDPEELTRQSTELGLLQSSYKVRDHARETGDWTDHHTEAIEAIGTALLLDIGWEEEAVENHMREVVESIDGLQFDAWFEDED